MTPQERERVADLFDRLATLEGQPRDPDAARAIQDGLRQAPNAVYALVQSVLVQDEALKRADARMRELEAELNGEAGGREPRGFLDSMRDVLMGERDGGRGSVPSVRAAGGPMGAPSAFGAGAPAPGQPMANAPAQEQLGRGGSFLGTAAAAAAGMIGGGLLLDGIRSMLGGQQGAAAGERFADDQRSPWGGNEGGGDLARSAGLDDIGSGRNAGEQDQVQNAGFFGGMDDHDGDGDYADDDSFFDGGSDEA